jgi:hypothetical protein
LDEFLDFHASLLWEVPLEIHHWGGLGYKWVGQQVA